MSSRRGGTIVDEGTNSTENQFHDHEGTESMPTLQLSQESLS